MTEEGVFSGGSGNLVRWMSAAGVVLALAAAAVIVAVLARRRKTGTTVALKWALLIGLFLLPSMTMLLGNVVGFHRVKQSCADCHTMTPWIEDMRNPESNTLAAKHYRNRWINEDQCYTCHTGYGLAGNVEAKVSGMRHVWHYYFTGVPDEIKMRKPFPQATCLHCHADAGSYRKIEQHVDPEFAPKILSGELSCMECHETPHPKKAK